MIPSILRELDLLHIPDVQRRCGRFASGMLLGRSPTKSCQDCAMMAGMKGEVMRAKRPAIRVSSRRASSWTPHSLPSSPRGSPRMRPNCSNQPFSVPDSRPCAEHRVRDALQQFDRSQNG